MEYNFAEETVQEKDFPQKGERLKEIIADYNQQNNIFSKKSTSENPFDNVEVTNEVTTREFKNLTPELQKQVLKRIEGLDYLVAQDILNFGSVRESPLTKYAEIIISKYSASELSEMSDPLTNLVATLRTSNPSNIIKKIDVDNDRNEWGIVSSVTDALAMRNAKKKMFKSLAEHESIQKNLKAIEVELKKQEISLKKDIQMYEEMAKHAKSQVEDFELDCIALNVMLEEAKSKLESITNRKQLNLSEMNDANDLKFAIERMESRLQTIETMRLVTLQSIVQIAFLIRVDVLICQKINEVQNLLIPLWTWQYSIAIGALKQKEALNVQKSIRGITSKLLTGNAKLIHDNMIATQKEVYEAAVAIEDLAIVQEYIDDMVSKVSKTRELSSRKCFTGMIKIREIEQKIIL